jgi:hypothetical protein
VRKLDARAFVARGPRCVFLSHHTGTPAESRLTAIATSTIGALVTTTRQSTSGVCGRHGCIPYSSTGQSAYWHDRLCSIPTITPTRPCDLRLRLFDIRSLLQMRKLCAAPTLQSFMRYHLGSALGRGLSTVAWTSTSGGLRFFRAPRANTCRPSPSDPVSRTRIDVGDPGTESDRGVLSRLDVARSRSRVSVREAAFSHLICRLRPLGVWSRDASIVARLAIGRWHAIMNVLRGQ